MNSVDPLAQLRDIHLPEPVSWWPPAPGWWIVFLVSLAAVVWMIFLLKKFWLQNRYRRIALRELKSLSLGDENNQQILLEQISSLLRRVALQAYGRKSVAPLAGQPWLEFLDDKGNTHHFTQGAAKVLGDGLYRSSVEADLDKVMQITRSWIKGHQK